MVAYGETIDAQLRSMMPSFAECYERLSEAIHAARADAQLFADMRAKIEQHFAFRAAARI